jgi:coproporphyrinogen III oxidase
VLLLLLLLLLLQNGNVWEKAGVNVSVVYGSMPPDAYR